MKTKASQNRTLSCSKQELECLSQQLVMPSDYCLPEQLQGRIICADFFKVADDLPKSFVDLLILDPPYNLSKNFNGNHFRQKDTENYAQWFENVLNLLKPTLKANASVYVCSDWKTSMIIAPLLEKHFYLRNRITWEREKGRGAKSNWKNNTEDIWFCTNGKDYFFDVNSVKVKKKVLAPYRENGAPKDWQQEATGGFRLTHPSNIWTDITVPFWSMPENTEHPTQKPEKLIAKLLMASSRPGDYVFDPFLGSGTTAVVAHKLSRRWSGVEMAQEYCCWALKRIEQSRINNAIQGYTDGVFWDRNSLADQTRINKINKPKRNTTKNQERLFV